MTSHPPISENLTLFDVSRQLLAELQVSNKILINVQSHAAAQSALLTETRDLLAGFTGNGATFSAYQVDPFTHAYLAVMGPLLARRLDPDVASLPEMMKGATLLARELVEELAAYRSERAGLDYLEEQTELLNDPWGKAQQDPSQQTS
tara:strand:+ start:197 stop:640 length:444 start_codon:yes stop_codon:yes gene_type:complete